MKNILKKKNIWIVSAIIIFVVFIGYTLVQDESVYAQGASLAPTDNPDLLSQIKAPIHRGGGQQTISGFMDLISPFNGSMFDATSPEGKSSVFEVPSDINSFLVSLGNSWVGGMLFVGVPRYDTSKNADYNMKTFSYSEDLNGEHNWVKPFNYGSLSSTLQKVNVQGEVLATNLIHTGGSDNVCIDPNGSLVMCPEVYHWETGDWSDCSEAGAGTCGGSWITTGTGSCEGNYQTHSCDGSSWNGRDLPETWTNQTSFNWKVDQRYNSSGEEVSYMSGDFPKYMVVPVEGVTTNNPTNNYFMRYFWNKKSNTGGSWNSVAVAYDIYTANCGGASKPNEDMCENGESGTHDGYYRELNCNWNVTTHDCSSLNTPSEGYCNPLDGSHGISGIHNYTGGDCSWNDGADTTHQCSDKSGTSENTCEDYNSVCSWVEGGASIKTRTVSCKDSSGQVVADSFCTSDKPVISENCGSYSCTGSTPAYSGLCPEDSSGLTGDLSKLLVSSCSSGRKCEYECQSGYYKSGSSCVEDVQVKIDWSGSVLNWVEGTNYGATYPSCGYSYRVDIASSTWQKRMTYSHRTGNCLFRDTTSWSSTGDPIYQ